MMTVDSETKWLVDTGRRALSLQTQQFTIEIQQDYFRNLLNALEDKADSLEKLRAQVR
jgi:hypothetical protein